MVLMIVVVTVLAFRSTEQTVEIAILSVIPVRYVLLESVFCPARTVSLIAEATA